MCWDSQIRTEPKHRGSPDNHWQSFLNIQEPIIWVLLSNDTNNVLMLIFFIILLYIYL